MVSGVPLPSQPGSYALVFEISREVQVHIGRAGLHLFPAGTYIYAGSAHGSGGLRARIAHHLRAASRPHWHLDYLFPHAIARCCYYTVNEVKIECEWSHLLAGLPGARVVMPGFGSSDCRAGCLTHLYHWDRPLDETALFTNLTLSKLIVSTQRLNFVV